MVLPFLTDQYFTNKSKMLDIYNNYPLYNLVPANFFKWDDNSGYNFHHVFASNPYNYGFSSKKSNVEYPIYSTRRIIPNSCSDSSVDGRSSDSNYTSSGGSIVSTDAPAKANVGSGNGSAAATMADGISGRFTRQTVNSRFPAMDMNSTYRIHKPPTYYPGMGAYAHLQQQQYSMNSTYPKVNYTLNAPHQQASSRRKSHQNNYPMQQQQQSPPYYYMNNNTNRAQHFNHHNQQKSNIINSNNNNNPGSNNCGNQETFKKFENLPTKDSDNLDGTYTICLGSKLSATLHQQHQQLAAASATNGRRFVNVDKTLTQGTKSSQTLNDNNNEHNKADETSPETENQTEEGEPCSPKTPVGSIRSATYSQKSTASAQSSNGSRSLKNEPTTRNTTNEDVQNIGEEVAVLTTPLTTVEATVNGAAEGKEVTSESPTKWRTGEDVLQIEDVADGDTETLVEEDDDVDEKADKLERNGSLASLQSKSESIKTQIGDTPPVLSRAQSTKSLEIKEEIEDNASFVVVDDVEESQDDADEDRKSTRFEENTEDSELVSNNEGDSKPNSATSRPLSSRSRSPTIEEIKALSRRNSMIKSMESLYERPPSKHEFNDNTTETSSQSSAQLNSSIGSTTTIIPPVMVKPQHTPLKQKSKTTHFLKSHRRISPVKQSIKMVQAELYPPTLQRFEKPREALLKTFDQLDSSNWEVVMVGLKNMVRLMRYHPDNLDAQMHMVCIQLAKTVRNLRSQVARAACQAATELFALKSRYLEQECDDLVTALLHRTADTNRFIRADATRALEAMCDNLTPGKILNILTSKGAQHQNALVRTTTAKLLNRLVERLGCDKIYTMPRDHRDKFFVTGANLLLEGSLETRSYAKSLFRLLSEHGNYQRMLLEVIPPRTYRNIEKTLKNIR
uniref:TOG domain-containing protein n=1 Tax=Stomoxys calcitrans TaxID=35570 RepID=A0A1I8P9R5_STOCA